ncbi:HK97 family phage prohead protease [Mesomycoplasma molare]|uniref:HK97 family phage prohead protease n=1 Tax=Mesomycoplasma molare TaxID=171288 RepID=A0ABY5TUY9_9BACT|nr:HK97 family phage prohead protease [Mesomycoplasma molare]UWD34060.1 HK97 family phage prohead protease [Mesomycoplasma molare]
MEFLILSRTKPTVEENPQGARKKRTLELSIELESWSPVYEKAGIKYREKLDANIFDFETPIELQNINSYLDHKVSIEHLLASTKNKTMNVRKENNRIIATIEVDEKNKNLRRVADLIEQGVIESNSFIFQSLDYSINETPEDKDVDLEFIYKKAKLISIDPVYEGFYPQDKCRVYSKDNKNILEIMEERKQEMTQETKQEQVEQLEERVAKPKTETEREKELEQELIKTMENNQNNEARLKELEKELATIKEENLELKDKQEKELKEREKMMEHIKNENLKTINNEPKQDLSELRAKMKNGKTLNEREKINLYNETLEHLNNDTIKEIEVIDREVARTLEKRALDGTTNLKGLALIETHDIPGILSEWNAVFPEYTEAAQKFTLTGLDEITKAVYVADKRVITSIAENAESTDFGGQTFKVKLRPERYSVKLTQNNALSHGDELWLKQIQDAKNGIIRALRKKFYAGIFTHAGTAMPTDGTYTGGVTQEAKFLTENTNAFTFNDIDNLVKSVEGQYGEGALDGFILAMHPDTLAKLEKPFLNNTTASFINAVYNPITKKYRGLQILTSTEYTDKEITKGKKPALLFNKASVCVYGLSFVINEDQYTDLSKDATNRYVKTRGEIKLIDPYINSRFIEVK